MSPGAERTVQQLVDHLADPLLVGAADDQGPPAVEELLDGDDLAGEVLAAGQHDVERLVEHDLGAAVEAVEHVGLQRPPASCGRRRARRRCRRR